MNRQTGSAGEGNKKLQQLLSDAVEQHKAGRVEEAKKLYLQILSVDVRHAPSLFGLGVVAQQAGNLDVATKMIRRAIAVDGSNVQYQFALGTVLQAQGKVDEALAALRRVLQLSPAHTQALFRMGNALQLDGKLEESIAAYRRILQVDPNSADAEFNIGNVLRLQGKLVEARASYDRALRMEPANVDALWNLSLLDLLEGDYAAGWPRYESRQQRPTPNLRSFSQPQWKGEPLHGARILLHAEQGLGDTLQFLRFVPLVNAAGGHVLLDVPKEMRRLAAAMEDVAAVTATGEAIPAFDWQCPLMSLPLAFGMTLDTIPNEVPYLMVPHEAEEAVASRAWPQQGLRVGLVWGATTRQFEDADRSIPLAQFESMMTARNTHFFSLQMGAPAQQLEASRLPLTDLSGNITDFADTAALIAKLDLVITVDTSVAHLAGGLGKPTWVLLPFSSDWRWLTGRDDSPWYPTVRLFRQPKPRDWGSVLTQVRAALDLMAS
jgi:Flp pilus assembly protein TadD